MPSLYIRFYGELNNYLPLISKRGAFIAEYNEQISVNRLIELIGIPLSAIDLILVNSEPVGFDHLLQLNDHISVYPLFRTIDISPLHLINRTSFS